MDKSKNNKMEEGYQLPEGYLDTSKLHLKSLQNITAFGEEGYTVPSDYFKLSKKNILTKSQRKPSLRIVQLAKYAGAIAAIMIGVYFFPKLMNENSVAPDLFADLSEAEVQAYLEESNIDLDLIESEWIEEDDLDALFTDENSYENYLEENVEDLDVLEMESFL